MNIHSPQTSVLPTYHGTTALSARCSRWLACNWLLLVNGVLGLLVGGALLTPVLYAIGWTQIGAAIFSAYRAICGQIPSHSYFVFGYQVALCGRNLAIYGSLLGGSVLFHWTRNWLRPMPWSLWLLTMLPMALDGFTQLFGWRESTWELRTLTGMIFGLGICWFVLPHLAEASAVSPAAVRTDH